MQPVFGNVAANVAHSLELIDQAASQGADLVVLPELSNTGYMFASREEAFGLAEQIPGGPSVEAWAERAARHGMHIVAGITERSGPDLYNSAVVIGPEGYIGTFRKVHLWNEENLFFEPGNLGFPGVPHANRPHWRRDLLRWLVPGDVQALRPAGRGYRLRADQLGSYSRASRRARGHGEHPRDGRRAFSNSIFIACADRVGVERGQPFEGQSLIVSYTGWPVVGPASREAEDILIAEVDLGEARRKRNWNAFNQVLRDRRADVYDEMLGSGAKRGWY